MEGVLMGKVALVTGGGSGIGEAGAISLARAGAHVIVADIVLEHAERVCSTICDNGGQADAITVDVRRSASVNDLFESLLALAGRLDIAVNNAGVAAGPTTFQGMSEDAFDHVVSVNLKGVWLCMRREIEIMEGKGGVIVNMASALGLIGSATSAAYVATKHGVIGLTKSAAIEHSANGIRVNAVCPGVIRTPLMEAAQLSSDAVAGLTAMHPIGRLGTPAEIGEAILWLASPSSSFVTGAALTVDGGWTAW